MLKSTTGTICNTILSWIWNSWKKVGWRRDDLSLLLDYLPSCIRSSPWQNRINLVMANAAWSLPVPWLVAYAGLTSSCLEEVLPGTDIFKCDQWWWKRRLYLTRHCHHQNDTRIRMGSDESHINVSLIVRDKVTRQHPQTTIFEEKGVAKLNPKPISLCWPAKRLTARPNRLTVPVPTSRWGGNLNRQTKLIQSWHISMSRRHWCRVTVVSNGRLHWWHPYGTRCSAMLTSLASVSRYALCCPRQ